MNFVLTADPSRVSYVKLTPTDKDIQAIQDMALKMGILKKATPMSDIIDRQFVPLNISMPIIDSEVKLNK